MQLAQLFFPVRCSFSLRSAGKRKLLVRSHFSARCSQCCASRLFLLYSSLWREMGLSTSSGSCFTLLCYLSQSQKQEEPNLLHIFHEISLCVSNTRNSTVCSQNKKIQVGIQTLECKNLVCSTCGNKCNCKVDL